MKNKFADQTYSATSKNHVEGKAAAINFSSSFGFVTDIINICSANPTMNYSLMNKRDFVHTSFIIGHTFISASCIEITCNVRKIERRLNSSAFEDKTHPCIVHSI
jgi:hypothetical protein